MKTAVLDCAGWGCFRVLCLETFSPLAVPCCVPDSIRAGEGYSLRSSVTVSVTRLDNSSHRLTLARMLDRLGFDIEVLFSKAHM